MIERLKSLTYLRALVIGAFFALIYYFVGYDDGSKLEAQIQSAKAEITESEKKIKSEIAKIESIEQFKKANAAMGETLQTFISFIPEKLVMIDLMKLVSNEAKSAGLNISRISERGAGIKGEFYESLNVDAELGGTFEQLMIFLSDLTKVKQILTLSRLQIRNAGGGRSANAEYAQVNFTAEIRGYRYVPVKTEGPKK